MPARRSAWTPSPSKSTPARPGSSRRGRDVGTILAGLSVRAWLAIAAVAWGIPAPVGVWSWTKAAAAIDRSRAVAATRRDEQQQCVQRIGEVTKAIDDAARKRIADALDAAGKVGPTPAEPAALVRLCDADPACRSHRR